MLLSQVVRISYLSRKLILTQFMCGKSVCLLHTDVVSVLSVMRKYFCCYLDALLLEIYTYLISNFCRVLNVICFLLGNSPASEFCMPTFRNTVPSS
jgi:hypothetical protein